MNKEKKIKESLKFLIDKGFVFHKYKDDLEENFVFSGERKDIILTYDIRLNTIDVGLTINEDKNYIPLLEANISDKNQIGKLSSDIESIYLFARNDWILSKKNFNQIVDLYANFIKENLSDILNV